MLTDRSIRLRSVYRNIRGCNNYILLYRNLFTRTNVYRSQKFRTALDKPSLVEGTRAKHATFLNVTPQSFVETFQKYAETSAHLRYVKRHHNPEHGALQTTSLCLCRQLFAFHISSCFSIKCCGVVARLTPWSEGSGSKYWLWYRVATLTRCVLGALSYLFMFYLTTLSITQNIHCTIIELLVNILVKFIWSKMGDVICIRTSTLRRVRLTTVAVKSNKYYIP